MLFSSINVVEASMLDEKCTQQLKTAVIDRILGELSKPEYVNKIHDKVLDPLIQYTFDRLYPYILITRILIILLR